MTQTTIYVRVPIDVKTEVQAYAQEHELTLAAAVGRLLKRGLAAPDQPDINEVLWSMALRLKRLESERGLLRYDNKA